MELNFLSEMEGHVNREVFFFPLIGAMSVGLGDKSPSRSQPLSPESQVIPRSVTMGLGHTEEPVPQH